jgi:hypothetical protein
LAATSSAEAVRAPRVSRRSLGPASRGTTGMSGGTDGLAAVLKVRFTSRSSSEW